MRKLYRSLNSLYVQNLLPFLADVQMLRYFLKKTFSFMVSLFILTSLLNRKLVLRICVSFDFSSKCMGGGQNILPELVSRVAAQF